MTHFMGFLLKKRHYFSIVILQHPTKGKPLYQLARGAHYLLNCF